MDTKRGILLTIILVFLVGCERRPVQVEPRTTPIPDETLVSTPTPVRTGVTILADGVVQAVQPTLPLAFEISGRLLAVQVRAGDQVQEGDVLARLEEAESLGSYQAAVTSNELAVLRAQQSLDDLFANAEISRTDALNNITIYAQAVRDAQYKLENYNMPAYFQGVDIIEALDQMKAQLAAASEVFDPYRYYSASDETRKERLEALNEAQNKYDHAVKRLKLDYELQVAQANLDKARADYDKFTAGPRQMT